MHETVEEKFLNLFAVISLGIIGLEFLVTLV